MRAPRTNCLDSQVAVCFPATVAGVWMVKCMEKKKTIATGDPGAFFEWVFETPQKELGSPVGSWLP